MELDLAALAPGDGTSSAGRKAGGSRRGCAPTMRFTKPSTKKRAKLAASDPRIRPSALLVDSRGGDDEPVFTPRIIELHDMASSTMVLTSSVGPDEPLFQPHPSKMAFSGYEAFGQVEKVLHLRNNDHVARRVKILPIDSPHFTVSAPRGPNGPLAHSKIAAGMEVAYTVTFRPQEVRKYEAELVVVTERESFLVPLVAEEKHSVLNLPDRLTFSDTAAKATQTKNLLVSTVGGGAATASLRCTHPAFDVSPARVSVQPGGAVAIEVTFTPELAER
jgi:hydrocephalus-inducing protein